MRSRILKPPINQLIEEAIERRDSDVAEEVLRKIDTQLGLSISNSEKADLLLGKAVLAGVIHKFDYAREQLRCAAEYAGDDVEVRMQTDFISACMYDEEGRTSEAVEALSGVLTKYFDRLSNDHRFRFMYEDIQQRRGLDLYAIKRYDEAIPVLKETLRFKLPPEVKPVVLAKLGLSFGRLQNYEEARNYLLQACGLGIPEEWRGHVYFGLAYSCAHLHLLEESKHYFQVCEQHAEEYGIAPLDVYRWLFRVCRGLGQKAEAERYERLARPM